MYCVLIKICELLCCSVSDLVSQLIIPYQRHRVLKYLRSFDVFFVLNGNKHHVQFTDLTEFDAEHLFVGKEKPITVDGYFYWRKRIKLTYPKLVCLVNKDEYHTKYYPLELLQMTRKDV